MTAQAGATGVDIVIVNWNAGEQLRACLASIARFGGRSVASVVVVDNASTDGSADLAPQPWLTVIRSDSNLGFGAACNRGAALGRAPFVLFLNPDAELRENTLAETMRTMCAPAARDIALCGVRMIDANSELQQSCSAFPTIASFAGQSMGLSGRFGFPSLTMAEFDHRQDRDVGSVIGAYYFIRRSVFEQLGGFDERFFVYYEELDLSLRVRRAGWRTRYLATPEVMHRGGGTTDQAKAQRIFYSLRSRLLYSFKNLSPLQAWGVVGLTALMEPLGRVIRALARRSPTELRETIDGYAMLLRDTPGIIRTVRADGER